MPPRFAYWTIILEGRPTAFRAHLRDELLPTLRQLQARHPDAVLMWFARGKLWATPDEEREARTRDAGRRERRTRDWRPGGEHKDPRARFKLPRDEKRRRFAERLRRDRADQPRSSEPPSEWQPRTDRPRAARRGPAPGGGVNRGARPQGRGGRKPGGGNRGGGSRGGGHRGGGNRGGGSA
jgi:uncharacterized membrane protein YgcG